VEPGIENTMTRFVILFFARSGSTHLVHLLRSHPEIACEGEVFDIDWLRVGTLKPIPRRLKSFPDKETAVAWLRNYFEGECPTTTTKARGLKFKYPRQLEHYPEVSDYLYVNNVRVIHLVRENSLKLAISDQSRHKLWQKTGEHNVMGSFSYEPAKLCLNLEKAVELMNTHQQSLRSIREWLGGFRHVLEVSYEDLLYHKEETLRTILMFLCVEPAVQLTSPVIKMTADNVKEALVNYEEIEQALARTEYARFLGT
jgi:LPS sulfotransferase NodH